MASPPAEPLVSIVVISHDYGRFLGEAIESALGQTYPSVEVLVVDDGSTDDSVEVASGYGDAIRLLTQPNQGIERTSNRGVREATGEYVILLSADDALEAGYVDELLGALRRSPDASFAYCRARMFGARTGVTRSFPYSPCLLAARTNYINASALMRRADFLELGGYSEELAGNTHEDWDLWLRMLEHGKRGTYVRAPLLRWRRHEAGSRNVQGHARLARSLEVIRARHRPLLESLRGARGRLAYWSELAVAAADVALGLSRSARVVCALEGHAWRRYRHLASPSAEPGPC